MGDVCFREPCSETKSRELTCLKTIYKSSHGIRTHDEDEVTPEEKPQSPNRKLHKDPEFVEGTIL